jgi:hypothetical protein
MTTELEARAIIADKERNFGKLFEQPDHPERWARMVGPLMAWAGFFCLAVIGGLLHH